MKKHSDLALVTDLGLAYQLVARVFARQSGAPESRLYFLRLLASVAELSQSEIAERLGSDPATVTRTIQDMEKQGLVARRPAPYDSRISLVRLSAEGKKAATEQEKDLARLEAQLLHGLSREAARGLLEGLEHVVRRAKALKMAEEGKS
ncbi:MAG: MarR family transcriptional regulator [Acidobacteria bacterium]|nr:MarR family transcriptional regulator [Acidobacteriota bacterium]MCG3191550.1 hypothetical protein [Thermoanaerobaculia bacterium]